MGYDLRQHLVRVTCIFFMYSDIVLFVLGKEEMHDTFAVSIKILRNILRKVRENLEVLVIQIFSLKIRK